MSARRDLTLLHAASAFGPVLLAALLGLARDALTPTVVALVLVLAVVAVAAAGDRLSGVVAALSAALGYDVFFTRPFLSPTIASPADVELVVASPRRARGERGRDPGPAGPGRLRLPRVDGRVREPEREGLPTDRITSVVATSPRGVVGHVSLTSAARVRRPSREQLRVAALLVRVAAPGADHEGPGATGTDLALR